MDITYYADLNNIKTTEGLSSLYLVTEDISIEKLRSIENEEFFGAVVPHIIADGVLYESGILHLRFMKNDLVSFHMLDMHNTHNLQFKNNATLLMFSDSLSQSFEPFISSLNNTIDSQVLFGSGVGNKTFSPIDTLFDSSNSYKDHSLIVEINLAIDIGVKHGWEPVYGPLVVTKSENNTIYELNNEPAFDVYTKILNDLTGKELNAENFFDITKSYPFGILSYTQNEFIIRDPLQSVDDALLMVSSIEENETIYIMKGEHSGLINAASTNAKNTISKDTQDINLLFDCISRVLYMDNDFSKEIEAISNELPSGSSIYGVTSIGEITNNGFNEIKIFNKTNLIGSISLTHA